MGGRWKRIDSLLRESSLRTTGDSYKSQAGSRDPWFAQAADGCQDRFGKSSFSLTNKTGKRLNFLNTARVVFTLLVF